MRPPRTRRGRPTKQPTPGEKASLGLKVTAALKQRLETEARRQGRSQSEEAEARLERTFDRQDLLADVMEATYGRQTMALLMILGEALRAAAGLTQAMWALEKGISATALDILNTDYHDRWLHDPRAYDAMTKAISRILDELRPTGDVPRQSDDAEFKWEDIPDYVVPPVIRALQYGSTDPRMITARRHLGDLIAYVKRQKAQQPQ
jgi:hypothetical protein